jgi:acetate---CoA ligase (ADP-forming)
MADNSLTSFFNPQGVAVIGASTDPTKLGYGLARNLVQSNYPGVVHYVNPKGGGLFGRPIYPSVAEVPDPVDLAILLIPAPAIPEVLHACGKRGIRSCIIGSGGFRETGPEGAALEETCLEIARSYGMRLMGPNCIGLLDTHLPLDATFLPPPSPTPGDVAFISHSGAICAAVIDWASGQGFGLSRLVSLGNQADITETDVLAPVAADPHTRVLSLYLEGVSSGRRFVEEAGRVARIKPVIALKVGRFDSGRRAVASHTGALAGKENAYNAAFRRAGVIRADTSEEIFNWARALAWCPLPKGRKMAVLTGAGGPGVTAADALEAGGLQLAELRQETKDALARQLPKAASLHNPVDMLATASPQDYTESLRILLEDPGVDGALVILVPPPMYTAGAVARSIIPVIYAYDKPVVIALMGERMIQEAVEHFRAARVPEYRFPERAASALEILVHRAEFLQRDAEWQAEAAEQDPGKLFVDIDPESVRVILAERAASGKPAGFLDPPDVENILKAYRIPVPEAGLARTREEAVQLAAQIDGPVVLKIASPEVTHKSDSGGVILGLENDANVREGFDAILRNISQAYPQACLEGVYVQQMIPMAQEVIIGAVQDPQFGALVMFGSGGIEVEELKDVEFDLAPLSLSDARRLVDSTWAGRKLKGYRSLTPADRAAVLDVLMRVARLAADFPQLLELEINPLRVLPVGQGVVAVDTRIRVDTPV